MVPGARAQSAGTSLFQPSLTDPGNVQRFKPIDQTAPASAKDILPASGAGETGFKTFGSIGLKKKVKKRAGEPHPLPPKPQPLPGAPQTAVAQTSAPQIKDRAAYADAYKPPDTPARRPAPPLQDPYEPLGLRVSTFVVKPAVEVSRGYDTNPSHIPGGKPSGYTVVEPTLKVLSNWSRHEYGIDLRGNYSRYDKDSSLSRPLLDVKSHSRIDVSRDTTINTESRLFVSTDYPGSPNLPVGFAKLPISTSYGSTVGVAQRFNRLEVSAKGTTDRTQYDATPLVDGSLSSNKDRDFNQYGWAARASYELLPGIKPFVELGGDVRKHDLQFDRDRLQRDSQALTPRVGSTFDIARRLTGEISVGYLTRKFEDPTLVDLKGVVADASLIWNATGLTTATLTATSRADETVLNGVSGVLRRDVGVQIDHSLRRYLIWTTRAGYGMDDYVSNPSGLQRHDTRVSLGTALTYKFTREVSLKGEYRYDQMWSDVPGVAYNANVFLIGLKLQR
ncbi:MAG: outer membrane beta-barrel protein [Hyphomicrobiales bacterium]